MYKFVISILGLLLLACGFCGFKWYEAQRSLEETQVLLVQSVGELNEARADLYRKELTIYQLECDLIDAIHKGILLSNELKIVRIELIDLGVAIIELERDNRILRAIVYPKHFATKKELIEFIPEWILIPTGDCDDAAEYTMNYAKKHGYWLPWELYRGMSHMANIAYVEDEDAFYGVDFNSKYKRLWYVCPRD